MFGPRKMNVLQFFIFNEIFGNSTIFRHFNISIYITDNLDFKGKFVAKFLIKSYFLPI